MIFYKKQAPFGNFFKFFAFFPKENVFILQNVIPLPVAEVSLPFFLFFKMLMLM